jgi:cytochrome c-type biogenesis protein CcmH
VTARLAVSWALAVGVLVAALVAGSLREAPPASQQERVYQIAATLSCPQCDGQSVAESDAAVARQIRIRIAEGLEAGLDADRIQAEIAAGYDQDIRLNPSASGVTGLVWALPVMLGVFATGGLVLAFRRWSNQGTNLATDQDRELVAAALVADPRPDVREPR